MNSISSNIMNKIQRKGRGHIFTPRDFLNLGSRQCIDTTLCRLAAQGKIRRLARGIYDYPKQHPILGDLFPSLDQIAATIAKDTSIRLQISGAAALHKLGLTTQVPAQIMYLTDGQSRDIHIGNSTLRFRHSSPRIMVGAGNKTGVIIQAIRYLGKSGVTRPVINKIRRQLTDTDKHNLKKCSRHVPGWAQTTINLLSAA